MTQMRQFILAIAYGAALSWATFHFSGEGIFLMLVIGASNFIAMVVFSYIQEPREAIFNSRTPMLMGLMYGVAVFLISNDISRAISLSILSYLFLAPIRFCVKTLRNVLLRGGRHVVIVDIAADPAGKSLPSNWSEPWRFAMVLGIIWLVIISLIHTPTRSG